MSSLTDTETVQQKSGETASPLPPSGDAASEAWDTAPAKKKRHFLPRPSSFRFLQDASVIFGLHYTPMILMTAPLFLLFAGLSVFLEIYAVQSAAPHLAIFAVGSYLVFSSYFVAMYYMSRLSQSYAAIPNDKKFYVLSNLIKSAVLLTYTPLGAFTLCASRSRYQYLDEINL
jgi:hypothetical protein